MTRFYICLKIQKKIIRGLLFIPVLNSSVGEKPKPGPAAIIGLAKFYFPLTGPIKLAYSPSQIKKKLAGPKMASAGPAKRAFPKHYLLIRKKKVTKSIKA